MLTHHRRLFILGPLIAVISLVAVVMSFLFLKTNPEHVIVRSADGVVEVEGDMPASVGISVLKDESASSQKWTAVDGGVYIIEPNDVALPVPVVVRVKIGERSSENNYAIGYFDIELGMWVPQDTARNDLTGFFETQTVHFSPWALLRLPHLLKVSDEDMKILDDGTALALPVSAKAYAVDLAYATEAFDFVLWKKNIKTKSCSGQKVEEAGTSITTERRTEALVDTVKTPIILRSVTSWTYGDVCNNDQ